MSGMKLIKTALHFKVLNITQGDSPFCSWALKIIHLLLGLQCHPPRLILFEMKHDHFIPLSSTGFQRRIRIDVTMLGSVSFALH